MITELSDRIIEPVTLEDVKDHLGYPRDDTTWDDAIRRNITAARQMLEGRMDMYIAMRGVRISPLAPGPVELPYHLVTVEKVSALDSDGVPQDLQYEVTGTEMHRVLHYILPEDDEDEEGNPIIYTEPSAIVRVGFETCPEDIATGIIDIVKAKYDRAPVAPVLQDVLATLAHYRRYRL